MPEPKESAILDESPKQQGVNLDSNWQRQEALNLAVRVHEGTMASHQTVIQSAQAYLDWLTSD